MSEPEWSPVTDERLAAIMEAAAMEYPAKIWSAAEVYAMAREVKRSREMSEIRASYRRVMLAPGGDKIS